MKLGSAFSDSIVVSRNSRRRKEGGGAPWWVGAGRPLMMATFLTLCLFVLFWRLFDLTVIHGRENRMLADGNRTRELVRQAPRGLLLDRTGKPLVVNTARYRLIRPCDGQAGDCLRYLSKEAGDRAMAQGLSPSEYLEVAWLRTYPFGEALSHVLGYTGELSAAELASEYYKGRNYRLGDRVGRMGAEVAFEERLRGRDGKEMVEVDASGKILRTLGRQEEIPGEDISLSLDAGLARVVAASFPQEAKGAVVVTKPTTGEILALFASPGFTPDAFSLGMSETQYTSLLANPDRPLFNRSVGGGYPPGSTFKIVTALAALSEEAIKKDTTVEDVGVITLGAFTFPNWYFTQYGKTEGAVDIIKAIQRSNDIFFYKAGEWLGITKLAEWARRVGIGRPLGIEIAGEAAGLMPDPTWKNKRFNTKEDLEKRNNEWYLGDTYHVSIGQGYLLTTPLQVNAWTNVIANDGKLCRPTILKAQSTKHKAQKENCKDLNIKREAIELITEGMRRACAPGGTGWPLFNFNIKKVISDKRQVTSNTENETLISETYNLQPTTYNFIPVACKTGTAEFGDPHNRTHAWFTVFAPLSASDSGNQAIKVDQNTVTGEPEISVTVLVEGAGEGSNVAAPIAKKILEEWFGR